MKFKLCKDLVFQTLEDKIVVWNPEKKETVVLNSTGWFILGLIDEGINEFEEIVERVAKEYGLETDKVHQDVKDFLEELKEVGIICVE